MPVANNRIDSAPRFSGARLGAGAFAGVAGGLAFGVLMIAPAVIGNSDDFDGMGMMTQLAALLGTSSLPLLWVAHVVASALFGLLFAAFVAPRDARRTIPLAMAWGFALWIVGAFLFLRAFTGAPIAFDLTIAYNLLGHLVFGAVLGLVYVAFFREEQDVMRERRHVRAQRPAP